MKTAELENLTKCTVKMYMKSGGQTAVQRVVIKMVFFCSPLMPVIKSLFPSAKLIFNTRHIVDSIESWERTFMSSAPLSLIKERQKFWLDHLPVPYLDEDCSKLETELVAEKAILDNIYTLSLCYGGSFLTFIQNKRIYSHVVLYEDFVQDFEEESKMLLAALCIPEKQVGLFLEGSKKDSQKNVFKEAVKKKRVTDEQWAISDRLQEHIGSPIRKGMTMGEMRNLLY